MVPIVLKGAIPSEVCARWRAGILAARGEWTPAFGGEQFSLGRAFYTHLEEDETEAYFAGAPASDACVERHAPGLQDTLQSLLGQAVHGRPMRRPGWCGAGVHVFPAQGHVATNGGTIHFDVEGLAAEHAASGLAAVSLVVMLQPGIVGGETRLWNLRYAGAESVADAALQAAEMASIACRAGDALLFDSYHLHQIAPFGGAGDRISATLHGAEVDAGLWETWF